jgi:hypothetical protein
LFGIVDGDVYTKVHTLFREVDIEASDLGIGDSGLHGYTFSVVDGIDPP